MAITIYFVVGRRALGIFIFLEAQQHIKKHILFTIWMLQSRKTSQSIWPVVVPEAEVFIFLFSSFS